MQVLSGANTYSGSTTITAGTLQLGTGISGQDGSINGTSSVSNSGALIYNLFGNQTAGYNISGSGSLTKLGNGALTLGTNGSTFTGNATISGGTVVLNTGGLGNNAATSGLGNPQTVGRLITVGSGAALSFTAHDVFGNATSNPVVTVVVNGGTLATDGHLITFGPLSLNNATLIAANGSGIGYGYDFNGLVGATGGTLSFISAGSQYYLNDTGSYVTQFDVSPGAVLAISGSIRNDFDNHVSGLSKIDTGLLQLSGVNTYTGATNVSAGTLEIGNGGSTGSLSASSVISNSGVLAFSRSNTMTQGTDFSSAAISGSGSLVQLGPGSLILNANNYTGATTVAGGALYLNGTNATPTISVAAGATLGGSGSVTSGTANVANGGIFDFSQNGGGTFTLAGLNFAGSATLNLNYAGGQYAAKSPLSVTSLTTSSTINVNVTNAPLSGNGTMELLKFTGTIGGSGSGAFNLASPVSAGRSSYDLTISGSTLDLNYSTDYPFWTGSNSTDWDTTTYNWKTNSNNLPTQYLPTGDNVVFDDRASGSTQVVAINSGNVAPATVTFSNTAASYTLTGSNGITGSTTTLAINGPGTVTIATSNNYGGATAINNGVLVIGDSSNLAPPPRRSPSAMRRAARSALRSRPPATSTSPRGSPTAAARSPSIVTATRPFSTVPSSPATPAA